MAISDQLSRLFTLRNDIRSKLMNIGLLPSESISATLSDCYNVLAGVDGLSAMSYTPTSISQVISSGQYLSGDQVIEAIPSSYIIPSGTSIVTSNDTYDITSYASISVNVPIPSGYIIPSGTITLSESGTFDIASYANADVTVSGTTISEPYGIWRSDGIHLSNLPSSVPYGFLNNFVGNVYASEINDCLTFGGYAFASCQSIYIDRRSVLWTQIGSSAFMNCQFYFNDYSGELDTLIVDDLNSIGAFGFGFQWAMTSSDITFEYGSFPSLESLASRAFYYNPNLTVFTAPLLSGVIGASTFYECPNLKEVNAPNVVGLNGAYAFARCNVLSSINLPSVSYIYGDCAFSSCTSLTEITLSELVTIGSGTMAANNTFSRCTNLVSVYMPKLSIIIGGGTFVSCTSLLDVDLHSLEYINGTGTFSGCTGLSSIAFNSLRSIYSGRSMFRDCSNLKKVGMPLLENYIDPVYAFYSCTNLESMNFPCLSELKGSYVFYHCWNLSTASFASITTLSGSGMFKNCYGLISMFLLSSNVCVLGNTIAAMFGSGPISTYSDSAYRFGSIYVPSSLLASYKAATNWTTVSSKIFAYEDYFGTIGSFGYVDSNWTPFYEEEIDGSLLVEQGNGWCETVGIPLDDYSETHCIVEFDGVVYPLAIYSSNTLRFGAPVSGTSSYNWDYYPFHVNCAAGEIVCQTSENHSFKMYSQLP